MQPRPTAEEILRDVAALLDDVLVPALSGPAQHQARVAASLVHMHTNRMLRSAARAQELVLYDFLHRLYTSRQARERKRS